MRSGGDPAEREAPFLVDAGVALRTERGLVRGRRRDAGLRDVRARRAARQKRDRAADGPARRQHNRDVVDVLTVDADGLRGEFWGVGIVAARAQYVTPRRHVRDRECAVPLNAAAVVDADLSGTPAALGREIHVAAGRRRPVRTGDVTCDVRRAHELHAEVDIEHFGAESDRNRLRLVYGSDAGEVRGRVRQLVGIVRLTPTEERRPSTECGEAGRDTATTRRAK